MPGETSHGLLPTYLIWYEDQGDVVPLNGKEILTRYKGRHTTRELDSSLVLSCIVTLSSVFYPTCISKPILTRKEASTQANNIQAYIK